MNYQFCLTIKICLPLPCRHQLPECGILKRACKLGRKANHHRSGIYWARLVPGTERWCTWLSFLSSAFLFKGVHDLWGFIRSFARARTLGLLMAPVGCTKYLQHQSFNSAPYLVVLLIPLALTLQCSAEIARLAPRQLRKNAVAWLVWALLRLCSCSLLFFLLLWVFVLSLESTLAISQRGRESAHAPAERWDTSILLSFLLF